MPMIATNTFVRSCWMFGCLFFAFSASAAPAFAQATTAVPAGKNPPGVVDLPAIDDLPEVKELPNLFEFNDGSPVKSQEDWAKRREELKQSILYYQYGHAPPAPTNLKATVESSEPAFDGQGLRQQVLLELGPEHKIKIHVGVLAPAGKGPFPVVVKNDRELFKNPIEQEILKRGYMLVDYNRHDLDKDDADRSDGVHPMYPEYDWATLSAWAWGGSRVIDYLVTRPDVDKSKIAFTGHSRGGKTALLAGALDERIALTVPNGSGCGGSGCYRVHGEKSEHIADITKRLGYWFQPRYKEFAGRESRLPFDQHSLKALVAPRALLSTDALGDLWANPLGTQQTHLAVQTVYDFLGAGSQNGQHFRTGGHAQNAEDWLALIDFADHIFFQKPLPPRFNANPFPDAPRPFTWTAPAK